MHISRNGFDGQQDGEILLRFLEGESNRRHDNDEIEYLLDLQRKGFAVTVYGDPSFSGRNNPLSFGLRLELVVPVAKLQWAESHFEGKVAEALTLHRSSGWRLPTVGELQAAHRDGILGFDKTGNYLTNEAVTDGEEHWVVSMPCDAHPQRSSEQFGRKHLLGTYNDCLARTIRIK